MKQIYLYINEDTILNYVCGLFEPCDYQLIQTNTNIYMLKDKPIIITKIYMNNSYTININHSFKQIKESIKSILIENNIHIFKLTGNICINDIGWDVKLNKDIKIIEGEENKIETDIKVIFSSGYYFKLYIKEYAIDYIKKQINDETKACIYFNTNIETIMTDKLVFNINCSESFTIKKDTVLFYLVPIQMNYIKYLKKAEEVNLSELLNKSFC